MRKIPLLLATLAVPGLLAAGAAQALAHPGIKLRTYADSDGDGVGDPIQDHLDAASTIGANGQDGAMVLGPPMSPKQSCNLCHSYDAITSAYHFQLGLDERVDANADGFADEFGQVAAGEGGPLETLPTLFHLNSPGQFGAW